MARRKRRALEARGESVARLRAALNDRTRQLVSAQETIRSLKDQADRDAAEKSRLRSALGGELPRRHVFTSMEARWIAGAMSALNIRSVALLFNSGGVVLGLIEEV